MNSDSGKVRITRGRIFFFRDIRNGHEFMFYAKLIKVTIPVRKLIYYRPDEKN